MIEILSLASVEINNASAAFRSSIGIDTVFSSAIIN
jgi:hypothetical protein